jgi:hypothetical protein
MKNSPSDIQFLKDTYATARNKYKPSHIKFLFIGEAPPCNLDRYFYFEEVKVQDSLFLEIMGVLYPEQKQAYLASGRDAVLKRELLQTFQEDGYWLLDLWEAPGNFEEEVLEDVVANLLARLKKHIGKSTPIILVKTNVFDSCYAPLAAEGYKVSAERLPFPGSGQQRVFREKFKKALSSF